MGKVVRNNGIYISHFRTKNPSPENYIFIGVFFVNDYMCFEWKLVDDPITIHSRFLRIMSGKRKEVQDLIKSGEINSTESKTKYAKYNRLAKRSVAARFEGGDQVYKDVVLIPSKFRRALIVVDTHTINSDISTPENTVYEDERVMDHESLTFYKY